MADTPSDIGRKLTERLLDRAEAEGAGLLVSDLRGYARDEGISWSDLASFLGCSEDALNRVALCRPPRHGDRFAHDVDAIAEGALDPSRLLALLRLLSFRRLIQSAMLEGEPLLVREPEGEWGRLAPGLVAARESADSGGPYLLHDAAAQGMAELVRHLLAVEHLDPDALDLEGRTALEIALRAGRESAAEALIAGGAAVTFVTAEGASPLHLAAHRGLAGIVAGLLEHGADVNARDMGGLTPLHMAALAGHVSTVEMLIGVGADIAASDAGGRKPLDVARSADVRGLLGSPGGAGS